ncbi:hypothetical protein RvY_02557 [Ramazzottius varieornatus]|uniref:Uncharacterized protein n=1 Tax=Ramazzottius varieornatus TaxID=947166 RepID=A0A1D1UV94_RAMVA|nr:hypothetical protein RvY_02557 [Ramazzottius varieornatus]
MVRGCKVADQEGPLIKLTDADIGVRAELGNLSVNLVAKSDHVVFYCKVDLCNNGELDEMIADYKRAELRQPVWKCRNLDVCYAPPKEPYDVSSAPSRPHPLFSQYPIFTLFAVTGVS